MHQRRVKVCGYRHRDVRQCGKTQVEVGIVCERMDGLAIGGYLDLVWWKCTWAGQWLLDSQGR